MQPETEIISPVFAKCVVFRQSQTHKPLTKVVSVNTGNALTV